ncbi:MAG TPA: hypothetical protein VLJ76_01150 [Gaiellaceae bacterium]|nr:hypothetical protein [Gaiellaceae bacterium]
MLRRYAWIVRWWGLSRLLVFVPAIVSQAVGWPQRAPSLDSRPLDLLTSWDGRWYRAIANHGYLVLPGSGHQNDTAFFPLYPIALRALRELGLSLNAGGLLLANAAFLVGLVALYELARNWVAEADARRTVVYAALFPFGFVFSMVYPEGLVLAAAAIAGVLALRGRWLGCALAVACATLARPEGVFLTLPVLAIAFRSWNGLDEGSRGRAVVAILAGPLSLLAFGLYQWHVTGDALAFSHAQAAWGRTTTPGGIYTALVKLVHAPTASRGWLYRDAAFCLVYLICLVLAYRARVPRAWIVAGALIVLLPLISGSWQSDARFGLLALPVYCGLAYAARRRWLDGALRVASGTLLALGSATILLHWP